MTLKVLENFAGIGTQRMALENLGIEHEVVGITEIDKFAIKSYEAIHGSVNNLGDISLLDPNDVPDHDLFTYSFPCQDISVNGKGLGFEKGSGTRSGLLWECEKIIQAKKPKYLLMENVKNLVSKKFIQGFEEWLQVLENMGYTNYWQILNAKDYGIPQNRNRVFCVSILGEHDTYHYPDKKPLDFKLKDVLEDEVDERFYLNEEKTKQLITTVTENYTENTVVKMNRNEIKKENEFANTLLARDGNGFGNQDMNGVIEPTLLIKNNTKKGYIEATNGDGIDLEFPNSTTRRGRVQKDLSQTLNTSDNKGVVQNLRIRKLTPKEHWRLMGISDEYFEKAKEVTSVTQLYKQAGNAIVVNVLEAIFKELFK